MMNETIHTTTRPTAPTYFGCERSLALLLPPELRDALDARFSETIQQHRHRFHLAVAEADALAHQTGFRHLFFPTLAMEKVEALAARTHRQKSLGRGRSA